MTCPLSEQKKLKNLRKFRDGHRQFVQKTFQDAKDLNTKGNPVEVKRLKVLPNALKTKYSELQSLDYEIVDLENDVNGIVTEVSESCELMSVIQMCIVQLVSVLERLKKVRDRARNYLLWCNLFLQKAPGTSEGYLSKAFTHAKLPKLELKKFHGNSMHWYPLRYVQK